MAWNPGRFNFFSPDRPGPSLHITAAATSLTSFINVSGQPKLRKRPQGEFLDEAVHVLPTLHFWPILPHFAVTDCGRLTAECLHSNFEFLGRWVLLAKFPSLLHAAGLFVEGNQPFLSF